ncbi:putative metalloprotease CJM1_0395 family protein [Thauera sp.]|jgi:hypothetical protein|uniref:putative metalloprotease CJM1_0395 family protein n=1 Tax=Thauera sp. TaxID=1905334 RepID=UPI002C69FF90|nr:putative metalloprotease CJM1_0395 family protein [Thauera sp.]HRO36883.1 putative metalloprotease CJM1_0395 family protein [Thauera sp.]
MSVMSVSSLGGAQATWRQAATISAARSADTPRGPATAEDGGKAQGTRARSADTLSEAEQRQVAELKERDREVRAHEMAHVAAGAGLVTRGASYTYQTGPDGQRYAIGGEVGIDTSPGRTPEETLAKAERIRAAALAPAEPSGQDRQVAAQASRMAVDARLEIARREFEQGGARTQAPATRDGPGYRGLQAAQAYSSALIPGQAPSLSATA